MPKRTPAAAAVALSLFFAASTILAQERGAYQETVSAIMARREAIPPAGARTPFPRRIAPRPGLPGNPASPAVPTIPAALAPIAAPAPAAPQTLGVTFLGAQLSDSNAFPPDSMGAAGPTQFLVGINGRIRTFAKATGVSDGVLDADIDVFFNSVRNGQTTSDPRVRYDRLSGRWIVSILNAGVSFINNRILIAVSDSGTITGSTVWTFYYFEHDLDSPVGDTNLFLDYDTLGVDANALVIGGNIFDGTGNFMGTTVHVVRKSAVTSGSGGNLVPSGNVVAFRNLTGTPSGPGPYTPQGVDDLIDASSTTSWVAGVDNATFGTLMLRKVTFSAPLAWPPSGISANLSLTVATTAFPLLVPHQGNAGGVAGELDALDDRLFGANLRGGHIWAAHNIAVTSAGVGSASGDRDGSRWYEIDISGGSPSLVQSGTLFDAAASNPLFYWIPSIVVSGQGHAALGVSVSGSAHRVDAATAGRLAGDAGGTLQTPLTFTSSSTSYNPAADPGGPNGRRWGDYSYTSVDPNDDMTLWTIQEYCNAVDSWGVRVAQLVAPPPGTPVSTSPASVAGGLPSVDVDITGTSSAGSGFFDPGAGFPNRLSVAIPGVTINGVTFHTPTTITANVSTVGSSLGSRTVTATNPDGQSRTSASAIFSVVAGGPAPTVTAIAPTSGPATGGTPVSVSGTNFVSGSSVTIGGADASGVFVNAGTMSATAPVLPAGTLDDVTVTLPDSQSATLSAGWLADFLDVPQADIFHSYVEKIFRNGVTAGCGGGAYCRNASTTRAQMAVFLLKAKLGSSHVPPACAGVFADVPCPGLFTDWVEELYAMGITGGCNTSPLLYCPVNPVTRAQMAVFLLKADLGSSYTPPPASGTIFDDVHVGDFAADWIEDLFNRGITGGCSASPPLYCPNASSSRGQMAVFLVKTFNLP